MPSVEKARLVTLFTSGVQNARAVEQQAIVLIERQLERIEHYPQLSQRLREHLAETDGQIQRLDAVLAALDAAPSPMTEAAMALGGNMAAMANALSGDEILKNCFANYAFEHYEIASYKALITLAQAADQDRHLDALRSSLSEEEEMAHWLDAHLRAMTLDYADSTAEGRPAER